MAPSIDSIAKESSGVNARSGTPLPQAQTTMLDKVMEHEPLIRKCAASMVRIYHADFDDLYNHLVMALFDKATLLPDLLSRGDGYIFTCLKNEIHSYMRRSMNEIAFSDVSPTSLNQDSVSEADRLQLSEDIRLALEHLDDECRELVKAILENSDLIRESRRIRKNRPNRKMINVNALARRMGKPKSSVYRGMANLRLELALEIA